jgi:hypothetical protein
MISNLEMTCESADSYSSPRFMLPSCMGAAASLPPLHDWVDPLPLAPTCRAHGCLYLPAAAGVP